MTGWELGYKGSLSDKAYVTLDGYVRAQQHKVAENVDVTFVDPKTGELYVVEDAARQGKP